MFAKTQTYFNIPVGARAAALAAAVLTLLLPLGASAQSSSGRVVLTPGTVIPVTLNQSLSSKTAQPGDSFTASVDTSKDAYNRIMQGAVVDGVVKSATAQSGSDPGTLDLSFTRLRLSNGSTYAINGVPASLDTKNLQTNSQGLLVAKNTNKDEHLTYAGYGAGAGLLVGLLSNGKLDLGKTLIGGALGYAAGSLLKGPTQVHDVQLDTGTPMGVLLNNRVAYYHRSSRTLAPPSMNRSGGSRKYYSYGGHEYYLDTATGNRVMVY